MRTAVIGDSDEDGFGRDIVLIDEQIVAITSETYVFVFELTDGRWKQVAKIPTEGYDPYLRLSASSDTIVAGPAVFDRTGPSWRDWKQTKILKHQNEEVAGDAIIDGDTLYVGHGNWDEEYDGDTIWGNGGFVVFKREGDSWKKSKAYRPMGATVHKDDNNWGNTLAFDGDTLVTTGEESHYAYVLRRSGSEWKHEANLRVWPEEKADFGDGSDLALHNDTLFRSTPNQNGGGIGSAVYVMRRSGSSWEKVGQIVANPSKTFDGFGQRISLSEDGSTLAVTAQCRLSDCNDDAAYVFEA